MAATQGQDEGLALVIGAGGGLGAALVAGLQASGATVLGLGRHTVPALDLTNWRGFCRPRSAASATTRWAAGTATGRPRRR
jgi:NAD(P)-dependent dehydrogenase (short-subunit alcohol dehydrogenase family)